MSTLTISLLATIWILTLGFNYFWGLAARERLIRSTPQKDMIHQQIEDYLDRIDH